jgi:hypothetical protein
MDRFYVVHTTKYYAHACGFVYVALSGGRGQKSPPIIHASLVTNSIATFRIPGKAGQLPKPQVLKYIRRSSGGAPSTVHTLQRTSIFKLLCPSLFSLLGKSHRTSTDSPITRQEEKL